MDLIGVFLLYWWCMQLIYKLTDFDEINSTLRNRLPNNAVGNFFYKLFSCQFCMESHIGFLLTLPISYNALCFVWNDGITYDNIIGNLHLIFIGWIFAAMANIIKLTSR